MKPVAKNVTEVTLSPENESFSYSPGQFAFLRFHSDPVAAEEHPFTISSTPFGTRDIQFTIKESGDFTRTAGALRPGDTANVSGPFGVFTPARFGELRHLVMVAGGIGITPMLSILNTVLEKYLLPIAIHKITMLIFHTYGLSLMTFIPTLITLRVMTLVDLKH